MVTISLPNEVENVFREFRTCELTTLSRDGVPTTWPTSARYQPEHPRFLITTSIGFSQKAFNIRRNPRVSILFSDSTGSGLVSPASVLVQGDAVAPDEIVTAVDGLEDYWRETIFGRQPATAAFHNNFLMQKWMDWNYMRILIYIKPRLIFWWPASDFSLQPLMIQVPDVE
jgi:nitroimidazol reductase NimA-like FMN-containing flavoprotein (pyridoxamine 5'-phosphate oxidase superfamily)